MELSRLDANPHHSAYVGCFLLQRKIELLMCIRRNARIWRSCSSGNVACYPGDAVDAYIGV